MASAGAAPASTVGKPGGNTGFADKLPDEINEMKIKDEKAEKVGFSWTRRFTCVFRISHSLFYSFYFVAGSGSSSSRWKWNRNRPHYSNYHWRSKWSA